MAEDQSRETLEHRAENLKATLETIRDVDSNGDQKLTREEFAAAFVRAYVAQQRRDNPNETDPLKTLRADIAAAQASEAPRVESSTAAVLARDTKREELHNQVVQDLSDAFDKLSVPPTPAAISTLLRNNIADGGADEHAVEARAKARAEDAAQNAKLLNEQDASKQALLSKFPPELLKEHPQILDSFNAAYANAAPPSQVFAPEQNADLQKVIGDLRGQLAGYKQENIEAPPTLQQLSEAVNRDSGSKGNVR